MKSTLKWTTFFESPLGNLALFVLLVVSAGLLSRVLGRVTLLVLKRGSFLPERFTARRRFADIIFVQILCVFLLVSLPMFGFSAESRELLQSSIAALLVFSLAFLVQTFISLGTAVFDERVERDAGENTRERAIRTQIQVISRVGHVLTWFLGVAFALLMFEEGRRIGTSLIASAGVIGVVLGVAAQKSLGNIMAGLQIAFTQPVKLGDAVVIEGEWGRIEEITLTYIVVRLWDLRRLIIPITYFLEKPFQNWTRMSANLLGHAFLYVDYRTDVERVREQFLSLVKQTPLWDGQVALLQVAGLTDRCMELRALVSAADATAAFDIRCLVREQLMAWFREEYPEALPEIRINTDLEGLPAQERTP